MLITASKETPFCIISIIVSSSSSFVAPSHNSGILEVTLIFFWEIWSSSYLQKEPNRNNDWLIQFWEGSKQHKTDLSPCLWIQILASFASLRGSLEINSKQPSSLGRRISIYVFAEECNHIRGWTTWEGILLWVTDHSAAVLLHRNSVYETLPVGWKQPDSERTLRTHRVHNPEGIWCKTCRDTASSDKLKKSLMASRTFIFLLPTVNCYNNHNICVRLVKNKKSHSDHLEFCLIH